MAACSAAAEPFSPRSAAQPGKVPGFNTRAFDLLIAPHVEAIVSRMSQCGAGRRASPSAGRRWRIPGFTATLCFPRMGLPDDHEEEGGEALPGAGSASRFS